MATALTAKKAANITMTSPHGGSTLRHPPPISKEPTGSQMIECTLQKIVRGFHCFVPSDQVSSELCQKIGKGRELAATLRPLSPMSAAQRRMIFALAKVTMQQIGNFPDLESAMDFLKKHARHTRLYYNPVTNVVEESVRSITELDIDSASQFIERVKHAILTEIGPQLGAWELMEQVAAMTSRNG